MEYILKKSLNDTVRMKDIAKTFKTELLGRYPLYEDFKHTEYENTMAPGSMPSNPMLQELVNREDPAIIIEIGSYLGYSACGMAEALKTKGKDAVVICIDTWMGGLDGWKDSIGEQKHYKIPKKNGYPTFYYNFLANVCYAGMQDYIVPLAYPSTIGYRILERVFDDLKVKADMIFVDGSHEKLDILADLRNFFPLVRPGGLMFGDDYQITDVSEALQMFIAEKDIKTFQMISQLHWQIRK